MTSPKILILTDDPLEAERVQQHLQTLGYQDIQIAHNSADAYRAANQKFYEVADTADGLDARLRLFSAEAYYGESHFRQLVEQSPIGIQIFAPDGLLLHANHAWEKIWRARREDVIGVYNPLLHLRGHDVYPYVERVFAGESTYIPDTEFVPDEVGMPGKKCWASGQAFHVRNENGEIELVVIFNEDITERKQAVAERERLLKQVREIMNAVPEGVLLLESGGKILLINPVARDYLAFLAGASVGDTLVVLGDRDLAELLTTPPQGLWHEVQFNSHIFEVIARPIVNGSQPERWAMIIRDVTQARLIRQTAHQQERLAAVGQLAAGIAHDFNNILAVILLYNDLTLNSARLDPSLFNHQRTIGDQARRAAELIQQILDFSRRAVLERQPLDLRSFLKEQVVLLGRALPENIRVNFYYTGDVHTVNADPARLQQAIMNLAVNARDAMPAGGQLSISLTSLPGAGEIPCSTCGQTMAGDWVCIEIRDTGNGISPEIQAHLFEPFFTTKAPGQGTGLGLSQVYGIIVQHDGHIDVQSESGQGCAFHLYLPLVNLPHDQDRDVGGEGLLLGNRQLILIVEDDSITRQALADGLSIINYQILTAADGHEALHILESRDQEIGDKVDLVLSDVVMPEMGGVALFHALREKGISVPLILMSGHPMLGDLESLYEHGLIGWLPKPPNLRKLAAAIAKALQ